MDNKTAAEIAQLLKLMDEAQAIIEELETLLQGSKELETLLQGSKELETLLQGSKELETLLQGSKGRLWWHVQDWLRDERNLRDKLRTSLRNAQFTAPVASAAEISSPANPTGPSLTGTSATTAAAGKR